MRSQDSMGVSTADGNEGCCGACRSGGDLICCEGCPAAFHPECAGYVSAGEVPEGDWLCWFCAREQGKRYQHPTTQCRHPGGFVHILLATDDSAEVFCRVKLLNTSEKYLELTCMDVEAEPEIVPKTSPRLWHGTVNKAAWCIDADGIHWRPNCRTFKVDRLALAAMQNKDSQQQQQQGEEAATTPSNKTSPNASAKGTPGRTKLKLHFKGLKASSPTPQQDQQQQPQGQQAAAAAAPVSGRQRPPAAPGRVSVPPSPQLQPAGDSAGLMSPDSAGGPSPNSPALTVAVASAVEAASRRGVQRIPAGEVGAGLPMVQGGASKAQFDGALVQFWAQRTRETAERAPCLITIGGNPVDAWVFWREVWAWGGPEEVHKNKLWATLAHCFNPPTGSTSISTRMKDFYASMLAPFDKAIDAGAVELERPAADRVPSDRWLQVRAPNPSPGPGVLKRRPSQLNLQAAASSLPGVNTSAAPSPSNSLGGGPTISASTAAAAAAAAAGGGAGEDELAGAVSGGKGGGSGKQRQRQPRQRSKQRSKRKRADTWSDNDEDDVILADDVESSEYSDDAMQGSSDDEAQHHRRRQRRQHLLQVPQRSSREANSTAGAGTSGSSKPPGKRLRVNVSKVKEELVADGLDSAGGYEYLRQPTDLVVLGKVRLTPAARDIQVGDCVDFRLPSSSGSCVTGWRSGTVLAIAPGSEWEGSRRLLVKPQDTHHSHHHSHHHHKGSMPSLPPDSPAAAALAAVAAAGGPTGGAAAESAVQKLLTPSGHLRHELAGLLPTRSGSIKLGSAGDTPPPPALATAGLSSSSSQQQRQAAGGNESEAANQPQWVPMVWRGDCWQPFLAPPVLVRPHYAPKMILTVGVGATRAANGEGSVKSPFASSHQQQGQVVQQELRVGSYVEVSREGCWCPAQVLEVLPNGGAGGGSCVVLRSMAPPEADGSMWRCSGTHPMRPMHPRYTSGCGVVQCAGPEELITVTAMRKAMAPYLYSEGVHAFACLDHMQAAQRAARAAAQG